MKFLYFGTPQFSRIVLDELLKSGFRPAAVVTAQDKPIGRKQIMTESPVAAFAKQHGIEVLKPEKIKAPEFIEKLKSFDLDLIVVAAYGKIIPQAILDIPKHGAINVHPSLLPKWRGASPIPYTILSGDTTTGVTIMLMDGEMDHGPILVQEEVALRGDETTATLTTKLAEIGGKLLAKTIPHWLSGEITPVEQDHAKATPTKILTKEDGRIDWTKSAGEIERQVRAFDPWPSAWTVWNRRGQELIIKLLAVRVRHADFPSRHSERSEESQSRDSSVAALPQNDGKKVPGTLTVEGIVAGEGLIEPIRLQLAGKIPTSWPEFLRGQKDFIGSVVK